MITNPLNLTAAVTASLPANTWVHVAGAFDGATGAMCLYENGVLVGSMVTGIRPMGVLSGANPGEGIGSLQSSTSNELFRGMIDEARISNVPLGPGQLLNAAPLSSSGALSAAGISQNSVVVKTLGTVAIAPDSATSNVGTLTMAVGGKLDIANNTLMVSYGGQADPVAAIQSYLAGGYDGGAWDGSGIASGTAAAGSVGVYGVGFADSADGVVAGQLANTIEIRYTVMGDTNLDGVVNSIDAIQMARNYLLPSGTQWDRGDFNYDGAVTYADALILQKNFNVALPAASVGVVAGKTADASPGESSAGTSAGAASSGIVEASAPGIGTAGSGMNEQHSVANVEPATTVTAPPPVISPNPSDAVVKRSDVVATPVAPTAQVDVGKGREVKVDDHKGTPSVGGKGIITGKAMSNAAVFSPQPVAATGLDQVRGERGKRQRQGIISRWRGGPRGSERRLCGATQGKCR